MTHPDPTASLVAALEPFAKACDLISEEIAADWKVPTDFVLPVDFVNPPATVGPSIPVSAFRHARELYSTYRAQPAVPPQEGERLCRRTLERAAEVAATRRQMRDDEIARAQSPLNKQELRDAQQRRHEAAIIESALRALAEEEG